MTGNDDINDPKGGIPTADGLWAMHRQNLDALNGAAKLALKGSQTIVNRYGDLVSEAHRQFAVLLWRGTYSQNPCGAERTSTDSARRAIDTTFDYVMSLAEIATKLQIEGLAIFRHSALDSLRFFELARHQGSDRTRDASGADVT
jgi:Phasin protein